jgi:hypothetical protein
LLKKYRDKASTSTSAKTAVKSVSKSGYASLDDDEGESPRQFGKGSSSRNDDSPDEIRKDFFGDSMFKKK